MTRSHHQGARISSCHGRVRDRDADPGRRRSDRGGRETGARLHNPDFAAVAEAFGAAGYRVRSPEALRAALTKALADGRPAVIEVTAELGGTATPRKYLMPRWTWQTFQTAEPAITLTDGRSPADDGTMSELPMWARDALAGVYDPCCREKGISVVDMGLVRSVQVEDGVAKVELLLTSGWCPFAATVLTQVKDQILGQPGISDADVSIVWDEAWTTDRLSPRAQSILRFLPPPSAVADRDAYIAAHTQPKEQPP